MLSGRLQEVKNNGNYKSVSPRSREEVIAVAYERWSFNYESFQSAKSSDRKNLAIV